MRPCTLNEVTLIEVRATGPGFNMQGFTITIKTEFSETIHINHHEHKTVIFRAMNRMVLTLVPVLLALNP